MAKAELRDVEVWAAWPETPARVGILQATTARGHDVFSFEYDRAWLRIKAPQTILAEVLAAVRTWESEAKAAGLSRDSREHMASAFRLGQR